MCEQTQQKATMDCLRFLHFTIPACVCSIEFCLGNTLRFLNFQVESQRPELLLKILNFFFFLICACGNGGQRPASWS